MSKIIINNEEFILNSFTRNTNFTGETISSYAYMNIKYDNGAANLYEIAEDSVTSLSIKNSANETIYSLPEIDAHITTIDENYNGDEMNVNLNIQFNI